MYRSLLGQINWLQSYTQFQMLLHIFQMRFDGSFSCSWRGEVPQQIGETNQTTASETSVVATH